MSQAVYAAAAGCCAMVTPYLGTPTHCDAPVAWAGVHRYTRPRPQAVRAFACADHKDALEDPQPYGSNPEHEREMARRLAARNTGRT